MKFELSQEFYFDAAHTLEREIEVESSRRIHGHTYHAKLTITGQPDPITGMILDIGLLKTLVSKIKDSLDHRFLDEVIELKPATLENICLYIWQKCEEYNIMPEHITVERKAAGDSCTLRKS